MGASLCRRLISRILMEGEIMFCPKCRAEYREGFRECTDCDCDLVEVLEPLVPTPGFAGLATIFSEGDIAVIKTVFDQAGIIYYFEGEQSHRLAPVPLGVRLRVRRDFVPEAEGILKEMGLL